MSTDALFHNLFRALFLLMVAIRLYYHAKARTWQKEKSYNEGLPMKLVRALVLIPMLAFLILFMASPARVPWSLVALPEWLRWTGAALTIGAVALLWWVNHALGLNFSTVLRIREKHTLITNGPYRLVRHPMYTVILVLLTGFFLLTTCWVFAVAGAISLAAVANRTIREERMLLEAFGDEYRRYMDRTGRYFPRLRPLHAATTTA